MLGRRLFKLFSTKTREMNGLCNGVDANIPLEKNLVETLENLTSVHKSNFQNYVELATFIERSPTLKITNPIEGAGHKIKNYHLKAQKRNTTAFEELNSKYNLLLGQQTKLELEIDQIQRNSGKVDQELSKCKEEHKLIKEDFKAHKYALNLAKDLYDAKFGMDIEIESESGDVFVAVVYFSPSDKNLPVTFTIDRQQNKIIDFDASHVLTKDEEKEMKTKLEESGNILAVTSALRNKIIQKAC